MMKFITNYHHRLTDLLFETDINHAGLSFSRLFRATSLANLITFSLYHGTPDVLTFAKLLETPIDANVILLRVVFTVVCLILGSAFEPRHPMVSAVAGTITILAKYHFEDTVKRQLFPWEVAGIFVVVYSLYNVVKNFNNMKKVLLDALFQFIYVTSTQLLLRAAIYYGDIFIIQKLVQIVREFSKGALEKIVTVVKDKLGIDVSLGNQTNSTKNITNSTNQTAM